MKKWSEIQQSSLNKIFMELTEVNENVNMALSKMIYFANEALSIIANDKCPNVREIVLNYKGNYDFDKTYNVVDEKYNYYSIASSGTVDSIAVVSGDYVYSNGEEWCISKGCMAFEFPKDFLAFSEHSRILIKDKIIHNPKITYLGKRKIILHDKGQYRLYYNALYGPIPLSLAVANTDRDLTEDYYENGILVFNGIDISVLECLPSYIASQLILQNDLQMSTILKNEFEMISSRLEVKEVFNAEEYEDDKGWW